MAVTGFFVPSRTMSTQSVSPNRPVIASNSDFAPLNNGFVIFLSASATGFGIENPAPPGGSGPPDMDAIDQCTWSQWFARVTPV